MQPEDCTLQNMRFDIYTNHSVALATSSAVGHLCVIIYCYQVIPYILICLSRSYGCLK